MSNLRSDLLTYLKGLPEWQKLLSARMLELIEQDHEGVGVIDLATNLFLYENKLIDEAPRLPEYSLPEPVESEDGNLGNVVTLKKLFDIKNVNALESGHELTIAPEGITLIYGRNASGKSGYCRIFNKAFLSRGDTSLLRNVYGSDTQEAPTAKFEIDSDGETKKFEYPRDEKCKEFSCFSSFDSKAIKVHLDEKNDMHIEQYEFFFLRGLAIGIEQVANNIQNRIDGTIISNSFMNNFKGESELKIKLDSISPGWDVEGFLKSYQISAKEIQELEEIPKKIAELDPTEIKKTKALLFRLITNIGKLNDAVNTIKNYTLAEKQELLEKSVSEKSKYKKEAAEFGLSKFNDSRFFGVGSDEWKGFLEAGVRFEELQRQGGEEYPEKGKHCIYCKSELTEEASTLLKDYFKFLEGKSEKKVKDIDRWQQEALRKLEAYGSDLFPSESEIYIWMAEKEPEIRLVLTSMLEAYDTWLKQIKESIGAESWNVTWDDKYNNFELSSLVETLKSQSEELTPEKALTQIKKLEDAKVALTHKKVLEDSKEEILAYQNKINFRESLLEIKNLIKTNPVTNFSKKLHENYITRQYKQVFSLECGKLGVPQPSLKQRGGKGGAQRVYKIEGVQPTSILSEGEQRAVALADFFTEATISDFKGLIFDDPVSSFDEHRKYKISKRVVEEASQRQVVVFTHDLLFYHDIINECHRQNVSLLTHLIESSGNQSFGIIKLNERPSYTKKMATTEKARKKLSLAIAEDDEEEKLDLIKQGYSSLREAVEAFLVKKVLNNVVTPFDRQIHSGFVKDIFFDSEIMAFVSQTHARLSEYDLGHWGPDGHMVIASPDRLEEEIKRYEEVTQGYYERKGSVTQ